ncbi:MULTISPECIES: hypothetical protein [Pseudomonadota]|jgi:hypothetical protein|uniref:hypothetical protein n=1 Tax=Pseudomonadota TaxID=1224 RepID=UPI00076A08FB|nr:MULTISPECIES: hypothetical protein [Pseudomonadota]MAF60554.1 hypothetical protein [Blastomonas sp.]|tara:strand:+ start:143104 stop:144309 length:1206 start_codon:yes stop_codon:yes gene_type:complete
MEILPEQPDLPLRSLAVAQAGVAPDRIPAVQSGQGLSTGPRPALSLVGGSQLLLAEPAEPVPQDWRDALTRLAAWLELDVQHVSARPSGALRQVAAWAAPHRAAKAAPQFQPWQNVSPVAFQAGGHAALPRVDWVASYLQDQGTGKPLKASTLDVMLMSPHPAACAVDADCDAPMPRAETLQAMLQAALAEGRQRIGIVVDAQRRNALVRQLLVSGRVATRDQQEIEILPIEDALCHLVRHAGRWDAIIVLPELRSLVFAMLAELTGIWTPWPMLWHRRGVSMITGEVLDEADGTLPLNAPLLVQALALAAHHAGLGHAAQRLMQGTVRLWDCGIITPDRGSVAPYVTEVTDGEFIHQLCRGGEQRSRARLSWRAIPAAALAPSPRQPRPSLRLVATTGEQ